MARILKSGFPGAARALPYPPAVTGADRLALTVFIAIVIHVLVILGVGFVPQERDRREQRSLDVRLVQSPSPTPPEEAQFVAEANQRSASDSQESPSAPPPTSASALRATLEAAPTPPSIALPAAPPAPPDPGVEETTESESPAHSPTTPLSQTALTRDHRTPLRARKPSTEAPERDELPRTEAPEFEEADNASVAHADSSSEATLRARVMEDLSAKIDRRLKAYEERPRRKWITARTREHAYAAYMEAWRRKVERIGNLHYPQEARRLGLSGNLSLDVALNADGSVADIFLRRSSGERVLDEAALRIVELAAPFAEFPPSIHREVDILHVERTWQFSSGNRFNSR